MSYSRLVKPEHSSAGKKTGSGGGKKGNAHLKWAFSEAASLFLRHCDEGEKMARRLQSKHGKSKGLSILAAKLGRSVYYMLSREKNFDLERFLTGQK